LALIKLTRAFEIEVHELLKPDTETSNISSKERKNDASKTLPERFPRDLTVVLKDSVEKVVEHVKKE
jgi:hypothetical protein